MSLGRGKPGDISEVTICVTVKVKERYSINSSFTYHTLKELISGRPWSQQL